MSILYDWAAQWGISAAAVADLQSRIGIAPHVPKGDDDGSSEGRVQSLVRLEAAQKDIMLWRNNVGSLPDSQGRWIRYGLCNDSPAMNEAVKSADLIGYEKVRIDFSMIGMVVPRFLSVECKKPGWKWGDDKERESAQLKWAETIIRDGGRALFVNKVGML